MSSVSDLHSTDSTSPSAAPTGEIPERVMMISALLFAGTSNLLSIESREGMTSIAGPTFRSGSHFTSTGRSTSYPLEESDPRGLNR